MSAFEQSPPALTPTEIEAVASSVFDVHGGARLLGSERDQNALIDTGTQRFALKVANSAEDPAQMELQSAALSHLESVSLVGTPRLVRTRTGADAARIPVGPTECLVRMVTWLDGILFSAAPRSLPQLTELGAFMGRLSKGLKGFTHPAANRDAFLWSLDHVAALRPYADDIADAPSRDRIKALFDRYDQRIAPKLAHLRVSVLHQDANDNNIIVDPADPSRIVGLIDFGDMCVGRTINELAITLAYALLDAPDLYSAARRVIAGYVSEFPIEEDEADLLFDLMRMRLAASICVSSRQSRRYPDNTYLMVSQAPAMALLERLGLIDPEFMISVFRTAAGFPATRAEKEVRTFLTDIAATSMFQPPLSRSARLAVLTDGTHPQMPAFSDHDFDAWFARQRPENLPESVGFYGFGPYGEARSVYATDQFADAASAERRTRHLGIDVFASAMTPVYAPLGGKVAYIAYNSDPLDYGNTLILEHETDAGTKFWTLYGHLAGTLPSLLEPGQSVAAGDLIAHLGDWFENGGWSPHLHFQVMTDLLAQRQGNFFGVGHDSLWDVWSGICIDPNLILGLSPESYLVDPVSPEKLLTRRGAVVGPSLSVSYNEKLKITRGTGAYLYDHTGRKFLDAVNNITHVGHCHPHVVSALARQAAILNTNTRYLNDLMLDYAERLTAKLPAPLSVAYFVNSGTEANELALRIARTAIGKKSTIVLDWAYHGNSGGMVDISPYKFKRKGGYPQPDFVEVADFPDPYRGSHKGMSVASGAAYAADVQQRIETIAAKTGNGRAAFIAESISGVGGQVIYPDGYLQAAYAHIRAAGGVCIADEVQCGLGRVGSNFWGFELQDVIPDIVVMGKPIGNGHPLAAVVTTPELAARFANGMEYFNSFGGNPVSMAVGMAVLDVIESEGLQQSALDTGDCLLGRFKDMQTRHDIIGEVRGAGLFLGLELVSDHHTLAPATAEAGRVVNHIRQLGVLASTDGPLDNVLKFKPPMVFGRSEADILCDALELAFAAL